MRYICLQQDQYEYKEYQLLPIREQDIMLIKDWRNTQLAVLRQKDIITEQGQREYFNQYILPCFEVKCPSQVLFSFLKNGVCIGYGGMVHMSWADKRGEVSFLLDPSRIADNRVYREDFLHYVHLIKKVAYDDLKFHRLFTETYDIRPFHISVLEEVGFRLEGRMKQHIYFNNAYVDSLIHGHLREYDINV